KRTNKHENKKTANKTATLSKQLKLTLNKILPPRINDKQKTKSLNPAYQKRLKTYRKDLRNSNKFQINANIKITTDKKNK
ncbi:hypothetical protein ACTHS7_13310, partial [Neisseria sp. P0015.S009]|uniref:hypothetical protein n=1 Tax=Neisseria sp. P0015.S009 TaxID=3436765 RepID=UPI003F7FF254